MDFSLLKKDSGFVFEDYFEAVINEFKALGRDVAINKKQKTKQTNIESAFLKDDTAVYNLQFRTERRIKIKIEVDIHPPMGFSTENKLLLLPFSFMSRCYSLPDLYAGKMHALLFRTWKNRVKGRDWYDFEWYVRNNVPLNFDHFYQRSKQFKSVDKELTKEDFKELLRKKISETDIEMVKNDVRPFIKKTEEMDIWSIDYFMKLVDIMPIASSN